MALFRSQLDVPLISFTREQVRSALDEVLDSDRRIQRAWHDNEAGAGKSRTRHEAEMQGGLEPIEHVTATIVIDAPSASAAMVVVKEIYGLALRQVEALLPPDAPDAGWTSGWQHPEPVSE